MRTQTLRNLQAMFPEVDPWCAAGAGKVIFDNRLTGVQKKEDYLASKNGLTVGAEVEVRFRHYFPDIWAKYGLDHFNYLDLPIKQQELMSLETYKLEAPLLEKLNKIVEAGIPKGKDKYWEFAFEPCFNPTILSDEITFLMGLGAIPKNYNHSLQITIGGIKPGYDTGLLLMILELLFVKPERILEGVDPDKAKSWGRRSRAGIRERFGTSAKPLGLGKETAIEFRTLQLPDYYNIHAFLNRILILASCSLQNSEIEQEFWAAFKAELALIAAEFNLPNLKKNWGHSYENTEAWTKLALAMQFADKTELHSLLNRLFETSPYFKEQE